MGLFERFTEWLKSVFGPDVTIRVSSTTSIRFRNRAKALVLQNDDGVSSIETPPGQTWIIWAGSGTNSGRAFSGQTQLWVEGKFLDPEPNIKYPITSESPGAGYCGCLTYPNFYPLVMPEKSKLLITDLNFSVPAGDIVTINILYSILHEGRDY